MYLPENHARLKAAHTYVSEDLRALGIPFVSRGAGFFIWVDLRKVMQVEMLVVGLGGAVVRKLPPAGEHPELLSPLPVPARGHL